MQIKVLENGWKPLLDETSWMKENSQYYVTKWKFGEGFTEIG